MLILETTDLFALQRSSPSCMNITFCHASHHVWPQQAASLASGKIMAQTCVFFYLNRLYLIM